MKKLKLSQAVALEADLKQRTHAEITELHKLMQKADMYEGSSATYAPTNEGGERHPPKVVKVRLSAKEALAQMVARWTPYIDMTATRDYGNCNQVARASVVVGDEVLITAAPVPFLLFIEKKIQDLRKAIEVIPVLDQSEDWVYDASTGHYKTQAPVLTAKTSKLQEPIILHPATKEHPAQTQLITRDVLVGYWTGMKFSGSLPAPEKADMLKRANILLEAIKMAIEDANAAMIDAMTIGGSLYDFVIGK